MKRKSPAFSFYPDSWRGGTALMSHAEKGMYIDLLALNWLHGCLSFEQCLRGCFVSPGSKEAETLRAILDEKFDLADGLYSNRRIEEERMKQRARSDAGSKGGKKSRANLKQNAKQNASKALSKTASKASSKSQHSDSDSDSGSSTGSESKTKDTSARSGHVYSEDFERFWLAFPTRRRTKKREAERKWKIAIRDVDAETLISKAAEYAQSEQGRSEYAVMPSVWLNGCMWEDEPEAWDRGDRCHSGPQRPRVMSAEELSQWKA